MLGIRLEIRRRVDRAWVVILIQGVLEWAVVGRRACLLVVGIRIVDVILVDVVLPLAIHTPDCNSDTTE